MFDMSCYYNIEGGELMEIREKKTHNKHDTHIKIIYYVSNK